MSCINGYFLERHLVYTTIRALHHLYYNSTQSLFIKISCIECTLHYSIYQIHSTNVCYRKNWMKNLSCVCVYWNTTRTLTHHRILSSLLLLFCEDAKFWAFFRSIYRIFRPRFGVFCLFTTLIFRAVESFGPKSGGAPNTENCIELHGNREKKTHSELFLVEQCNLFKIGEQNAEHDE